MCMYQCYAPLPPIGQLMGIIWGLTEDNVPIVGNLITSDCIVKLFVKSPVISLFFFGF